MFAAWSRDFLGRPFNIADMNNSPKQKTFAVHQIWFYGWAALHPFFNKKKLDRNCLNKTTGFYYFISQIQGFTSDFFPGTIFIRDPIFSYHYEFASKLFLFRRGGTDKNE